MLVVAACLAAGSGFAGDGVRMPVSAAGNPLYLKGLSERPWWNADWAYRLPIVVSEMSTNRTDETVIEFEADLGRKATPESVRIVTPWETEVPCYAEAVSSTVVRVFFKTSLRGAENKPFFVYFGNDKATRGEQPEDVRLKVGARTATLENGALSVDFVTDTESRNHISRFHINGSPARSDLTTEADGTPSRGLGLMPHLPYPDCEIHRYSNRAEVIRSNPFVRTLRIENEIFIADYSLRSGSPRLDIRYTLKRPVGATFQTCWGLGGGGAHDVLRYPALNGVHELKACLDAVTDAGGWPGVWNFGQWFDEGWFQLEDTVTGLKLAQFFPERLFGGVSFGSTHTYSERFEVTLTSGGLDRAEWTADVAVVASPVSVGRLRELYAVWSQPPKVMAGEVEPRREIPVRRLDLSRDFIVDFNVYYNMGDAIPLDQKGWAERMVTRSRELGANAVRLSGVGFRTTVPLTKAEFDRQKALINGEKYHYVEFKHEWKPEMAEQGQMRSLIDAYHRRGMPVYYWGNFQMHGLINGDAVLDPEYQEVDLEYARRLAKMGFDAIWNGPQSHEGPHIPRKYASARGTKYWEWKSELRKDFFDVMAAMRDYNRRFYEAVKAVSPKTPVLFWTSDQGALSREMQTIESSQYCDFTQMELVGLSNHGIARMRTYFNNEPRTCYHHFYLFNTSDKVRTDYCEWPFIHGVNGFTVEHEGYSRTEPEVIDTDADFFRFTEYTGLGALAKDQVPVKQIAVFRDSAAFRDDVIAGRNRGDYQDRLCENWTTLKNFQVDLIQNRFFDEKSLSRYAVVAVPYDRCMTKAQFAELAKYVKAGGVAYVEGKDFPFAKAAAKGGVKSPDGLYTVQSFGKGKLCYSGESLSADMARIGTLARALIKEAGQKRAFAYLDDAEYLTDSCLRGNGKGRYIFGAIAKATRKNEPTLTGRVEFGVPLPKPCYALNVKTGERQAITNSLSFTVLKDEAAIFLIGDEAFTRVPVFMELGVASAGAANSRTPIRPSAKNREEIAALGDFRPLKYLVLAHRWNSQTVRIQRPEKNLFDVDYFLGDEPAERISAAIDAARIVHVQTSSNAHDVVFRDCGERLKALLKRGGMLIMDRSPTGAAARRFFKEVGVADPNLTGYDRRNGDTSAVYEEQYDRADRPFKKGGNHWHQFQLAFLGWDKAKQFAPIRSQADRDHPTVVVQEKVLGEGIVVFTQDTRGFQDFYENRDFGDNVHRLLVGDLGAYLHKAELLRGGPGEPFGMPYISGNR